MQFIPLGPQTVDITGERFCSLVVLGLIEIKRAQRPSGRWTVRTMWHCQCDCGACVSVAKTHLRTGHTTSCGCRQEHQKRRGFNRSHGQRGAPEYKSWAGMKQRCENPRNRRYAGYGGRGIKACDRWADFEAFFMDMGPKPSAKHSIDRRNNDGDYEPSNCRWSTRQEQNNNTRANLVVEAFGKRQTCAEWAREMGMPYPMLHTRLILGIAPEVALTAPWHTKKMRRAA
jgi:hypothetical protein